MKECRISREGERLPGFGQFRNYRVGDRFIKTAEAGTPSDRLHALTENTAFFSTQISDIHIPPYTFMPCEDSPNCFHAETQWLCNIQWGTQIAENNPPQAEHILRTAVSAFTDLGRASDAFREHSLTLSPRLERNGGTDSSRLQQHARNLRDQAVSASIQLHGLTPAHLDITLSNVGEHPELGVIVTDFEWAGLAPTPLDPLLTQCYWRLSRPNASLSEAREILPTDDPDLVITVGSMWLQAFCQIPPKPGRHLVSEANRLAEQRVQQVARLIRQFLETEHGIAVLSREPESWLEHPKEIPNKITS